MTTAIELPDKLAKQAKEVAALHGQTLDQFLLQALERAVAEDCAVHFRQRLETMAQENAAAWQGKKSALEYLFEERAASCH